MTYGTPDPVRAICKKVIDEVARDGGYIMDASALLMNDAKVENVKAMIDFTAEYGVYSQSSGSSLVDVKKLSRPEVGTHRFKESTRKPGTCFGWDEKRKEFQQMNGNEQAVRNTWEGIDGQGWGFCWVNLTW